MTKRMEWAVFRASDGPEGAPAEGSRYQSRDAVLAAIANGYTQPECWEPRGREVGEWSTAAVAERDALARILYMKAEWHRTDAADAWSAELPEYRESYAKMADAVLAAGYSRTAK